MRTSSGNIDPLTQITPLLCASSSPRTSTTWPSFIPTSTPHPVPQKRHTDLCQLCTCCRRATTPSRNPQPAAPTATLAPRTPRVVSTSRRLISEAPERSGGSRPSSFTRKWPPLWISILSPLGTGRSDLESPRRALLIHRQDPDGSSAIGKLTSVCPSSSLVCK